MEGNNLLRYLVEQSKIQKGLVTGKLANILDNHKDIVKFQMPLNGVILEKSDRNLPQEWRLPFPRIAIEYDELLDAETFGLMFKEPLPDRYKGKETFTQKALIIATQLPDAIELYYVTLLRGDSKDRNFWQAVPYRTLIPTRLHDEDCDPETGLYLEFDDEDPDFIAHTAHEVYLESKESFMAIFKAVMCPVMCVVLEMIEVLACKNVTHEAIPTRKLNKGAMKRGVLPFDEYRVLTIKANKAKGKQRLDGVPGEGRSPREHLRRHHTRTYKAGFTLLIPSTIVNPGVGHSLFKDYNITR